MEIATSTGTPNRTFTRLVDLDHRGRKNILKQAFVLVVEDVGIRDEEFWRGFDLFSERDQESHHTGGAIRILRWFSLIAWMIFPLSVMVLIYLKEIPGALMS